MNKASSAVYRPNTLIPQVHYNLNASVLLPPLYYVPDTLHDHEILPACHSLSCTIDEGIATVLADSAMLNVIALYMTLIWCFHSYTIIQCLCSVLPGADATLCLHRA